MIEAAAHARNVLHRVDQRVPARPAEGRRDDPDPRRHERHRHHGDSAGAGLRRARLRDRRQRREVRGVRCGSAPTQAFNYRTDGLGRRGERRPPAAAASTWSSTWSAATTSPATSICWPSKGGWCRSRSSRARKAELDFSVMMRKRLWITGSTLRPRTPEEKGVIARDLLAAGVAAAREGAPSRRSSTRCSRSPRRRWRTGCMETSAHIGKLVLDVRA